MLSRKDSNPQIYVRIQRQSPSHLLDHTVTAVLHGPIGIAFSSSSNRISSSSHIIFGVMFPTRPLSSAFLGKREPVPLNEQKLGQRRWCVGALQTAVTACCCGELGCDSIQSRCLKHTKKVVLLLTVLQTDSITA